MDKKIQEIRTALAEATPGPWIYNTDSVLKSVDEPICVMFNQQEYDFENAEENAYLIANAPEYISYLLQQIEIKDKALKEAETFVEELILAVDNCPPRLLDVEEIAQDGTTVINSIAAALKGEDTNE